MTFEEIKQIPDLQIEVTPIVEDAFYFLRSTESEIPEPAEEEPVELYEARLNAMYENSAKAGERLSKIPYDERMAAIRSAHRMIDNLKKYGVACKEWA